MQLLILLFILGISVLQCNELSAMLSEQARESPPVQEVSGNSSARVWRRRVPVIQVNQGSNDLVYASSSQLRQAAYEEAALCLSKSMATYDIECITRCIFESRHRKHGIIEHQSGVFKAILNLASKEIELWPDTRQTQKVSIGFENFYLLAAKLYEIHLKQELSPEGITAQDSPYNCP